MHWFEFNRSAPRLAALGERRLIEPGVLLVVTIRRDGTPRLSPVEALLWNGDLWLSMMRDSRKVQDLRRDPRLLLHNLVTNRDGVEGEYKVRGSAREVLDHRVERDLAGVTRDRLGWEPTPGEFHLFWVDIDDVTAIRYAESGSGDQFVTRWPGNEEYLRRGVTATSLGPRESRTDLLS